MIDLRLGDCLEVMAEMPDKSVDAVICDPPFGVTSCRWDAVIPFAPMWDQVKRLIKPRGAVVLFGSQPFTSALVMSNPGMFKYSWVWDKRSPSDPLNVKRKPMGQHEDIVVFGESNSFYNPQLRSDVGKLFGKASPIVRTVYGQSGNNYREAVGYPMTILSFAKPNNLSGGGLHPTQKPVALMSYLIKTYTNEGDTVLDFTMGSGSTGVACIETGRSFIGIEKSEEYFKIAQSRLVAAAASLRQLEIAV